MSFRRRVIVWILGHRYLVLFALAGLTVLFAAPLRHLQVAQSETQELSGDDPDVVYFNGFQERFDTAELMVVLVEADDLFSADALRTLRVVTEEIQSLSRVRNAFSLANAVRMAETDGEFEAELFLDTIPTSAQELQRKRAEALGNSGWVRNFVSADGSLASINVMLAALAEDSSDRITVVDNVQGILEQHQRPGIRFSVTGISPLVRDMRTCVGRDVRNFLWLTPLLIVVLLFLTFRTLPGVAIPMIVIVTAVIWTLGLFAASGRALGMATAMVPTLIAVICLSDVIHILSHYYELVPRHRDYRDALVSAMEHMLGACFMTSITTAAGFASMVISPIRTIREFGLTAAAGILIAYLLAAALAPVLLSFLPRAGRRLREGRSPQGLARLLAWAGNTTRGRQRLLPVLILLLVVACAAGISRLRVETQLSGFLPDSAPSVRALARLQEKMAGFGSLEVGVDGAAGVFREPWALAELLKLQAFLESRAEIDKVFSFAEILGEMHKTRAGGARLNYLPDDKGKIAEYILLLSISDQPELMRAFVSEDYASARVMARMRAVTTKQQMQLLADVEAFAAAQPDPRLQVHTTGVSKLYATQITALVRSQLLTLIVTSFVIALLLAVHLRSVRVALISMIPNLLPVLTTLGMMGLAGISLNLSTVMISCIALGIAVDDTIHFLVRYRRETRSGADIAEAMRRTVANTGRAMVFTSLVIAGGFALFILSGFGPNRHFGILMAFTMAAALVADLVLLPFLIRAFKIEWKGE